ncbi:hypothetical protein [Caballeronia sp. TF1N1]|uniref:hypothetical protein n=1 Tax=Caballeronia sp. TF1N1 TaxID=2878153 RepID=UPI001FD50534|nr:hypothetical protein [Caballeronia sp. TF1N1]
MNMGGEQHRAEARYQEFLATMAAQRYFLTIAEQKAAHALLAQGFGFVEVAALLEASPWVAFYRECLKTHRLPECPQTREALRESFDLGEPIAVAAERALEAVRRHVQSMDRPPVGHPAAGAATIKAAAIEFEIELFGRRHVRKQRWPDWMDQLVEGGCS